jgi:enoyl-CoA hydratase/carnithine racemase
VQRRIGLSATKRMMMTGSELSAIEASEIGFIDLCAPAGELDPLVQDLANEIIANSWHTSFAVKRLIIETDGMSQAEGLAHECSRYPVAPDHAQRMAAFTSSKPKRDG